MEARFSLAGDERRTLVYAIADILNEDVKYLGMPSGAYQVGDYTVDMSGLLHLNDDVEDNEDSADREEEFADLLEKLSDKGYNPEYSSLDSCDEGEDEEDEESEQSEDEEAIDDDENTHNVESDSFDSHTEENDSAENSCERLTISVPKADFTDFAIDNLRKLVQSKQTLIKMSLEADELPIEVSDDKVSFPWFSKLDGDYAAAYSQFVDKLCKRAKEASRIYGVETPFTDPRFSFRTFLVRLGFVGAEYSTARRILMERLPSSSSIADERKSYTLNSTVQSQIRTLQEAGEVNMFDSAAVQNAAHDNDMPELIYYIESLSKNPRREYINFLTCKNNADEPHDNE